MCGVICICVCVHLSVDPPEVVLQFCQRERPYERKDPIRHAAQPRTTTVKVTLDTPVQGKEWSQN